MIKKLTFEFCEANGKYDSFVNGVWTGKWYCLVSAMNGHLARAKRSDDGGSKISIEVSRESSKTIKAWIKEVNLHTTEGRHVTLPKACEIIIEDFSDVLRKDSDAMTSVMEEEDFASVLKGNEEMIENGKDH